MYNFWLKIISRRELRFITLGLAFGLTLVLAQAPLLLADNSAQSSDSRLITLYDRGEERSFMTRAKTLGAALKEVNIEIDSKDQIEPGLSEELIAEEYTVNIYRARPITVIDGQVRTQVITAARLPEQISAAANIKLYDEDSAEINQSSDLLSSGAGLELNIKRATAFNFTLYGETFTARTQAKTVGEMLQSKGIVLKQNDRVLPDKETKITADLDVRVWREGKQTVTVEEDVAFEIEKIQDENRPAGYRQIKTVGKKGKRNVSYEIVIQDGKEVARREISSIILEKPSKQVEIIGAKFKYTGGPLNEEQIAYLGKCESGMTATRNSGNGFYGAFQFMISTWSNVAPDGYRDMRPDQAPLAVQKQAVQNLLSRSSIFTQFPGCAKQMRAAGVI